MTLTKRLWVAIGHRFHEREDEDEITVWAKVRYRFEGVPCKRHMPITIELRDGERRAVEKLINECQDYYFTTILKHERQNCLGSDLYVG